MKKIILLICVAVASLMIFTAYNIDGLIPVTVENSGNILDANDNYIQNTTTPMLRVSSETFELATGQNGGLYEIGGSSFVDYLVWGFHDEYDPRCDIDSPYHITEINFILGERLYAGTGRGAPFWIELIERYGYEKRDEVMMLGHNYIDIKRELFRFGPTLEEIQLPPLYRLIHYFEISEEIFMAYHTIEANMWSNRCPDFIRLMFLPEDEMKAALLNNRGAIFNGTVHNILTLNELFHTDREAFSQIDLQELIQFQKNLESVGIYRGFNADLVEFANTYNVNSAAAD